MGDGQRPRPHITVRDPNHPHEPVDLLEAGDEGAPLDPAVRRRRVRVAGLALVLAGLVAGGLELRERQGAAAEERRLDRVVELVALNEGSSSSTFDAVTRTVEIDQLQNVRNDGPRAVVVLGASGADLRLGSGEVAVAPGRRALLLLKRTVRCADVRPGTPPVRSIALDVRTGGGVRSVELPLPYELTTYDAERACGLLPLGQSVEPFTVGGRVVGDRLELSLDVVMTSPRAAQLTALSSGRGFRVTLQHHGGGGPLELPVPLSDDSSEGPFSTTAYLVRITVSDCTAAHGTAAAAPGLELEVRDAREATAVLASVDPVLLRELLAAVC